MVKHLKKGGYFKVGICMSCKKKRELQDHQGLKLCHECEEKFFEPLSKLNDELEFGKDFFNDMLKKKGDK